MKNVITALREALEALEEPNVKDLRTARAKIHHAHIMIEYLFLMDELER